MQELRVEQLTDFVINGEVAGAISVVEKLLQAEIPAERIIAEGLLPGLKTVGDKYECGEFFLPELFSTGEVAKQVCNIIKPHVKPGEIGKSGTIIIGTVHGDAFCYGKSATEPGY